MVFNKIDLEPHVEGWLSRCPGSVAVSAHEGLGKNDPLPWEDGSAPL